MLSIVNVAIASILHLGVKRDSSKYYGVFTAG